MRFFLDQYYLEAIQDGRFSFAYAISPWLALLIVIAIIALSWGMYRKTTRALSGGWKTFFISLRSVVMILIFLCLLRPIVTLHEVTPQETYLAVLMDDSQSMSIADMPSGKTRQQVVSEQLYGDNGVLARLGESFQVRNFRFDKATGRITDIDSLTRSGNASSIDQALQYVDEQLGGLALGGIVLISDGADNGSFDPVSTARDLGAREIPVFAVGVGQEQIPRDIGIEQVEAARTVLDGTVFNLGVTVSQQGYQGREVVLQVVDGDTIAASRTIVLDSDGTARRYDMELSPERKEPIVYELQISIQADEIVPQNNSYQFLVDNSDRPALDILYVDGHPRNEYKFIRRAAENDQSLRIASYLQTGPGKFYRQGVNSALELNSGFPASREDLYQYEALLLGDIPRDFFNEDQLQMIQDFVAERGGGLLVSGMLEDSYVNSRIADILPVSLISSTMLPQYLQGGIRRGSHLTGEMFTPRFTAAGEFSDLLRLDSDDFVNRQRWQQMPDLQGIYITGRAKPGATVLLEHPSLQYQNQAVPVLATQRYGSGRSMFLGTASTWRWQMLMPSEDASHEVLWRQFLRWLSVSAMDRINIEFDREFYNAGDTVNVKATVRNPRFELDNNASVWLQLNSPSLQVVDNAMSWDIEEDGVYRSSFVVEEEGVYKLLVDVASAAAEANPEAMERQAALVVTPSLREYTRAGRDTGLLTRIAEASAGKYFNASQLAQLPAEIKHTPNAWTREIQQDIWNSPWLLALLVLLLCIEWVARRLKGLS
ncbi:MAG: hypothetical protein RQ757_00050 [Pseudomonadales bacterium]|nr:hypothetical protein [Pseudomonadales bacterium]